ncbi:hypothetical protein IQ06DRAFT_46892 [Phaeosphaeriaceae sp. SRC1lsM3a]|nr:hypothetical protein IQ06DRAFT_46892 [Stagonospora sp. SRC1lsM3a]
MVYFGSLEVVALASLFGSGRTGCAGTAGWLLMLDVIYASRVWVCRVPRSLCRFRDPSSGSGS